MSTTWKWILGITATVAVAIGGYFGYQYFFGAKWTEIPKGDFAGKDIEGRNSGTLEADTDYAEQIGANAMVRNQDSGKTWFKKVSPDVDQIIESNYNGSLFILS